MSAMTVHLVTGDDEMLLANGVLDLVHALVGGNDRTLMVDEFDGTEYLLRDVVDAALTPPLFTDRRVVVARGVGRFVAEDVAVLVAYLADPQPETDLVLGAGGGRLPKALTDALKQCGANVVETAPPSKAKDRQAWIAEQFQAAHLHLDAGAMALVAGWMGEDAGRLPGVVETLVSTYGTSGRLSRDDVAPFLGEAGDVPPWDLTDAIDRGETTVALTLLHRMIDSGGRHPLAVMSILHGHYSKLLKLDGAEARDEASAAAAMGIKPGFPARKALDQYRRLGGGGVVRAIGLLAQADLDLRGAKDWPDSLVMEVLVARLTKLVAGRR
jgi:DNA polymerase-3 subunit delta